jgi:hypothetical protein
MQFVCLWEHLSVRWMDYLSNVFRLNAFKLAVIATFCAVSIASDYAMFGLWNIKLMDFIVFISGFCFGSVAGGSVGAISWMVYGTLNPQGFTLPVLLATTFSEMTYGVAGGVLKKGLGNFKEEKLRASVFFASVGVLLTVFYDVTTNVVFGWTMGWNAVFAVAIGFFPFGFAHEVSNMVFFGVGSVSVISAINKVIGGERNVNAEE